TTGDAYDEFGPETFCGLRQRLVAHDDLRDAVSIPDVEEHDAAEIPNAVHPSEQDDRLPGMGRRQLAARVRSREIAERFDGHSSSVVRGPWSDGRCATSAEVTEARGIVSCSPVARFFILTSPRMNSSWPSTATKRAFRVFAYLNALPRSFPARSGSGYNSTLRSVFLSSVASRSDSAA